MCGIICIITKKMCHAVIAVDSEKHAFMTDFNEADAMLMMIKGGGGGGGGR